MLVCTLISSLGTNHSPLTIVISDFEYLNNMLDCNKEQCCQEQDISYVMAMVALRVMPP